MTFLTGANAGDEEPAGGSGSNSWKISTEGTGSPEGRKAEAVAEPRDPAASEAASKGATSGAVV